MKKKGNKLTTYWRDILHSFTKSKGRLFSIFALMGIGALALIGLKVTTPNMRQTAQAYIKETRLMDLAVMADYGLDASDVAELSALPNAEVEFSYLSDVTLAGTNQAVRVFSKTDKISQFQLVSGRLPEKDSEIALAATMSAKYRLGDKIFLNQPKTGALKKTEFTLVGFVNSAEIWDNDAMGQSRAGTGELTGYAVVPKTSFDSDVYMIARLVYDDLRNLAYYQADYEELLSKHQSDLEELLADNGKERLARLQSSAQTNIAKGYEELSGSEKTLRDGAQALSDGEKELTSGQDKLSAARGELASNQQALDEASQGLEVASQELDATANRLDEAKVTLDQAKATLEANKATLDQAEKDLEVGKAQLEASKEQLDQTSQKLILGQEELEQGQARIYAQTEALVAAGQDPNLVEEISQAQAELAKKEVDLELARRAYQEGLVQYQLGQEEYDRNRQIYQAGKAQYELGLADYEKGRTDYESGLATYQEGLARYQAGKADYESGTSKLKRGQEELASNQAQLAHASDELQKAEQDYQAQKGSADQKLIEARQTLARAEQDLADLKEPVYKTYTRKTLPGSEGYATYFMGANSISAVGAVFPVVLYLVAAMVTLTTMTRFVDEERSKAGILKALGYTKGQIIAKFIIYGLVSSLMGTLFGTVLGHYFLSPVIGNILTDGTVIGSSKTYFYPTWTLLAILCALLSAVLPAYLVARRELGEEAAQLLQSKPPVAGAKIFLERLPFIWKRLSFTHKVTARNIFRYKQRMLMTIFGVAGSVALLFTGLGIQSSISGVAKTQFGDLVQYDMIVVEAGKKSQPDLEKALESNQIQKSQAVYFENLTEKISGIDGEVPLNLIVTDSSAFTDYIRLRERTNKSPLSLGKGGAILSEKLASLYGLSVGDSLELTLSDRKVTVTVAGITEMYVGHYIYMTAAYYKEITGQSYSANSYLVELKDKSVKNVKNQAADFLTMEGVAAVVQNTALEKTLNTVANSLQSVMIILIVLSVLLGVVILYNLTNINVAERIRELSTIKVLGFHNREVTLYIYRETISLSLIGIGAGLLGGRFLHSMILKMIGSNQIMFQPKVAMYVYLAPIIAITGILAVLGYFVNHKLRQVDMLEALKSVE